MSTTYRIQGMTCGGCARHVEKALRAVAGVTDVSMDVAAGTATVQGEALEDALAASVTSAGYQFLGRA
jgi:copper chaperone